MNILNINNPFWRFLGQLFDVVVVNLLWTILCFPVITGGAATAAAYTVCMGIIRENQTGSIRPFFSALGKNWKQGFLLGLAGLLAVGILGLDLWYFLLAQQWLTGAARYGICAVLTIGLLLALGWTDYSFVLHTIFDNILRGTLKNALILTLMHPIRSVMAALFSIGMLVGTVWSLLYAPMLSVLLLLFGQGLVMFLHCLLLFPSLLPHLPKTEATDEEAEI